MDKAFRLEGPPADSLLGFLATVGLLMVLDKTAGWAPKLAWKGNTARLHVDSPDATENDVVEAAVDGIAEFGKNMKFPFKNLKIKLGEQSELQRGVDPDIAVACGSDASDRKDGNDVIAEPTPLCMMFGSGHQNFLARLTEAVTIDKSERPRAASQIREALFSKWKYKDTEPKIAFRWDPTEYRPHALRAVDPTKEIISTVNGANRLAAVGFTSFACVPARRGLSATLCSRGDIMWPIWGSPLSMAAVKILMTHPSLKKMLPNDTKPSTRKRQRASEFNGASAGRLARQSQSRKLQRALEELNACGVQTVMKARLFWEGKYKNVSVASPMLVAKPMSVS